LVIYGVALLAVCLLSGLFLGDLLGVLIGVEANVGGVGLAMLLLVLLSHELRKRGGLTPLTRQGVLFWSAIYIPVVVAMAAKQNVIAAVGGGPVAILAGVGAVALGFLLVPALSRLAVSHLEAEMVPGNGGTEEKTDVGEPRATAPDGGPGQSAKPGDPKGSGS